MFLVVRLFIHLGPDLARGPPISDPCNRECNFIHGAYSAIILSKKLKPKKSKDLNFL